MAGIYIHIPFCRKICGYCDFYRVSDVHLIDTYITALLKEIDVRHDYLKSDAIGSLYFGGGTPSLLSYSQLKKITSKLWEYYKPQPDCEITIEVNPDDVTEKYISQLKKAGFNRISIGIQSLNDDTLRFLNRRHNAEQAVKSIEIILNGQLTNISADLIYGIPGMSLREWEESLQIVMATGVTHLSAYHLTVEEGTPLSEMKKRGEIEEIDEELSNQQMHILANKAEEHGFLHYEISNFARGNNFSKHNLNYWRQVPYLGLGPSAHSYNGYSRQWNSTAVMEYIDGASRGKIPSIIEELNMKKRFNEYIMTSLRTMWGADLDYIEREFDKEGYDYVTNIATRLIGYGMIRRENNSLILTEQGIMISDNIITDFMMT